MSEESVKVAVRCRPFNQREKDRSADLIISMADASTTIRNPENDEKKTFTFDYSFWSHDGFDDQDGLLVPASGSNYADQQSVFDQMGKGVMDNALSGYNSCLFAYGQTGSGKSYSMVGYGRNVGIVPITCDAIFKYITEQQNEKKRFEVTIQMLEIYNEQVRDLFKKDNPSGGLKVRMNPKIGVEVVGLTEWPVGSYQEIEERIDTATKNRTVASTNMNATSSRAHTVVTISFAQIEIDAKGPGKHRQKKAKMNLVDLAGSERAASTGAQGDRLKEGAAINLSLTMLGNCITALAEKSMHPNKKVLVPYRESKLTMILQDALGGNSKTVMICALSPADINYEETLSTLRYADRAKKIKNKPKVNIDPQELLIQKLKEENEKLRASLGGGGAPAGAPGMSDEEVSAMREKLEAEMKENQEMLERQKAEMEQSFEERMAQARAQIESETGSRQKEQDEKQTIPHILNLHEDDMLSRAVIHFFRDGETKLGNKNSGADLDISLNGVSIKPLHATITNADGTVKLSPGVEAEVIVNGEEVSGEVELHHNDRLSFGTNYIFVVVHPEEQKKLEENGEKVEYIDYMYVQREIAKAKGIELSTDLSKMSPEERRQALINDEIVQLLPLVKEANAMSAALGRDVKFETEVVASNLARGMRTHGIRADAAICVKVLWGNDGNEFVWSREKFMDRVFLFRELWQKFADEGFDLSTLSDEEDPFWDPVEASQIGTCLVHPKELFFRMRKESTYPIIGSNSEQKGQLSVKLAPCFEDGKEDDEEDLFVDDPLGQNDPEESIVGTRMDVKIAVDNARGLPGKFSKETFVKFRIFGQDETKTNVVAGTMNPNFGFEKIFTWNSVTKELLQFFESESIEFEVWGLQDDGQPSTAQGADGKPPIKRASSSISRISPKAVEQMVLLESEKEELSKEVQALNTRIKEVEEKLSQSQKQCSDLQAAAASGQGDEAIKALLDTKEAEIAQIKGEKESLESKVSEAESKASAAERKAADLSSRLEEMKTAGSGSGSGDAGKEEIEKLTQDLKDIRVILEDAARGGDLRGNTLIAMLERKLNCGQSLTQAAASAPPPVTPGNNSSACTIL